MKAETKIKQFGKGFLLCAVIVFSATFAAAQSEAEVIESERGATFLTVGSIFVLPLTEKTGLSGGGIVAGTTKIALLDLNYNVNKYLRISAGYFGLFPAERNGRRNIEHRIRVAAALNFKSSDWTISNRHMIERRFRRFSEDSFRYRTRVEVSRAIKIKRAELTFFGNVEPFYDFSARRITNTSAQFGVRRKFARWLTGEFGYLQILRSGGDQKSPVISIAVQLPRLF